MKANFVELDYPLSSTFVVSQYGIVSPIPHLSLFQGVPINEFPNTFLSNCLVTTSSTGEFDVGQHQKRSPLKKQQLEPTNGVLEDDFPFQSGDFQVPSWISGVYLCILKQN